MLLLHPSMSSPLPYTPPRQHLYHWRGGQLEGVSCATRIDADSMPGGVNAYIFQEARRDAWRLPQDAVLPGRAQQMHAKDLTRYVICEDDDGDPTEHR